MLFNSIEFAIFLPIVFGIYWTLKNNHNIQNTFLLAASLFFYGWWDIRFLGLMLISMSTDFIIGQKIYKTPKKRDQKVYLILSILINLGILGYFKYYNFFIKSLISGFSLLGHPLQVETLKIILPVGISFYTFQSLSYSIDVYKKRLNPTTNITSYFTFVSFFPQLVAGPIERATNMLSQVTTPRVFNYQKAADGLRQVLWGLFKKIVIADNCAPFVNDIFNHSQNYSSSTLIIGAILFSIQIYADFSGYSDIAIGIARLFGFTLMKNFAYPYFSRDIAEFWRRWHISLSTWFRDYLYIPLGGSRQGLMKTIRNTFLLFIVSGFWHGANWTFIFWGLIHALFFLPLLLSKRNKKHTDIVATNKVLPSLTETIRIVGTFMIIAFGWIFFRAEGFNEAITYIDIMLNFHAFAYPELLKNHTFIVLIISCIILFALEWIQREKEHAMQLDSGWLFKYRYVFYILLPILIIATGNFNSTEFIYFAF